MRRRRNNIWQIAGVGLVGLVMVLSWSKRKTSTAWLNNEREVIERAVQRGDYGVAREMFASYTKSQCQGDTKNCQVLGIDAELEELIFPERVIERDIARYENLNIKYPGHRDILIALANQYQRLGKAEEQKKYWDEARKLDPNNPIFQF